MEIAMAIIAAISATVAIVLAVFAAKACSRAAVAASRAASAADHAASLAERAISVCSLWEASLLASKASDRTKVYQFKREMARKAAGR